MKTIRTSVFETNSSSVHCVTLMTDAEFKDFKDNDGLFDFFMNKPATWDQFYAAFKDNCKAESVPEDKVPTLLEFKEGMAKFEDGDYDPFEDGNANCALWTTARSEGIFSYDGVAEIEESDREIDGQVFHAVSAYVYES